MPCKFIINIILISSQPSQQFPNQTLFSLYTSLQPFLLATILTHAQLYSAVSLLPLAHFDCQRAHFTSLFVTSRFVKLISSDGHEFIVKREDALTSGTIKAMLSGPGQFSENETNEVNFREIPSHVLQKVCMYFTYKVRFTNSSTEIPEFPIPPEIALELLMAANFLDC